MSRDHSNLFVSCRANKDKDMLEKRFAAASKSLAKPDSSNAFRVGSAPSGGRRENVHDLDKLKRDNLNLNNEVSNATRDTHASDVTLL